MSEREPAGEGTVKPRLLVADDNPATRYLLTLLAEDECEVVGEAENGQQALTYAEELNPDIMILDVSMPVMSGLDAARLLRTQMPEMRIILVSEHDQRVYVDEATRMGIQGYVLKSCSATDLPLALREVLGGRSFYSPNAARTTVKHQVLRGEVG